MQHSVPLARVTQLRLQQFQRRRRLLQTVRGICQTLILSIIALLLAVICDSLIIHEVARWLGSLVVFATLLASLAGFCLRPNRQQSRPTEDAQRLETLDPRLSQRLVTAVELADSSGSAVAGSPAFLRAIQTEVGRLIQPVDARVLLPWQLLGSLRVSTPAALIIFSLIWLIPGLYMPQRVARILMPMADLGRVSRIAITIVRPQPQSRTIPQGEFTEIIALVSGPRPETLTLESRTSAGVALASMSEIPNPSDFASSPNDDRAAYRGMVSADTEWLEYRAAGADAHTPWYRLVPHARPSMVRFKKTIVFPDYASTSPVLLDEEHGHITAVEGSRVELHMEADQTLRYAELRWNSPDNTDEPTDSAASALGIHSGKQMDTSFSIEESASYQVFVQSEQTGFANEFSPIYRITAIADQPPLVRWMAPNSTRITASDSQMIPVKVQVQDEFPVDSLVARARMNGGEWEESQLDVRTDDSTISAANTPAFSAAAAWELDVASWSPQAGDILDVELVATDRLGNISRSTLLHVAISTRPTAEGPSSLELLHQQLAIQLEAMVGEMGLAENQLDSLLQRESSAEQNLAEQGVTSTVTSILASLESEESRLQHLLIKAIESTQSFAEEQVLMRVGESLAASQERFASDVDQQLLEPNAQAQSRAVGLLERLRSVQAARERLETISGSFQLLAGFPVMARHARQFVNLAEAHAECKQLMMDPAQSLHRLGRLQALFASQLLDVQQSMRDSIPNMAPDVAHQLQLNASQLGKSIESMERLRSSQNRDAILQAHEMVGFQLAQLSQFSKMAGNLLAEMENAENTIEQLSVSAEEIIGRLFTPQRSPGGTDKQSVERVVAQLAWMRQLHHTADGGSREYAADLGMSQRAVDFWAHEPNSDARELDLKLSEIAEAMGTLHALSYVADARSLLEQLLTSEQWTTTSPDLMVDNPRLWDAFLQRVEQSAKRLRRTEIPVSLIEELQQITSGNLSAQIEKKIVVRRWDSALVSVASEVQALVHELSQIQSQLAVYAAAARRVLQDHTPRISKLARRASQATRHVEEVTKHLAQAVSQEQTANESQQFAQLTADVQELSKPTRDLREALVDLAATQNLLDRRETQLARQADVAIDIVDQAEEMAQTSLSEVDSLAASEMRAEALKNSALLQSQSAAALEHLADHFDQLESQPEVVSDQTLSAQLGELSQLLDDVVAATDTAKPAGSSANESMYEQAAELAGMADSKPQDVLSQLEEELRTNQPMKAELSSIARQAVEDALQRLERAAIEQRTIANALELSDPRVNSLKALSMHDIQVLRDQMSSTLESLINEAKGTAGAGKQIDQERSLADTQTRLRSARDRLTDIALDSPREVLSERFLELRNNLSDSQQRLDSTAEELRRATFIEIHQNGADLSNRRREMRDRQRRIQQEMMRNSQAIERSQQSRLRQIDASLRQSEQHLEELVAQQTSVLARPKAPGPASDNGVNELAKRIDLARAAVQAELEMRTALEQRLTAAKQNLEKINQQELSLLSSANPSVELSSNLTSQAAEVISGMLELLSFWLKMDEDGRSFQMDQSRAAISQLRDSRQREQQVRNSVELASDALARAARHELRLEYQEAGATLNALASEIMWVATDHIERAQKNLDEVLVVDEANSSAEGRATTEKTAAIAQDLAAAEQAIRSAANRVRSLVQGGEPASSDESTGESSHATSATAQAPMDAQQKAQLLDELDQQVHGELSLRDQEDDTQQQDSSNGESSDSAPPNSLTQAAERLAKSMNRSRQPSGEAVANTDLGMATQSQAANVEPQGPAAVRLLDVVRSNSQWGELREQKTDELFETRREYVAPRFREQIQAYFRELAERGQ